MYIDCIGKYMMIQADVIPATRLAYLKATAISAETLGSSQDSCNISNTTSQELELDKMFLSFEVTVTRITESTTKLLKGFRLNVTFGMRIILQRVWRI
jgi:hypothetical protein